MCRFCMYTRTSRGRFICNFTYLYERQYKCCFMKIILWELNSNWRYNIGSQPHQRSPWWCEAVCGVGFVAGPVQPILVPRLRGWGRPHQPLPPVLHPPSGSGERLRARWLLRSKQHPERSILPTPNHTATTFLVLPPPSDPLLPFPHRNPWAPALVSAAWTGKHSPSPKCIPCRSSAAALDSKKWRVKDSWSYTTAARASHHQNKGAAIKATIVAEKISRACSFLILDPISLELHLFEQCTAAGGHLFNHDLKDKWSPLWSISKENNWPSSTRWVLLACLWWWPDVADQVFLLGERTTTVVLFSVQWFQRIPCDEPQIYHN